MDTIDITPSPHGAVRTIRHILSEVYGLNPSGLTDLRVLLWWKDYEYMLKRMNIGPMEGTKTLHKELLRLVQRLPRVKIKDDVPIIIEPEATWENVLLDIQAYAEEMPSDYGEEIVVIGQNSLDRLLRYVTEYVANRTGADWYVTLDEVFGQPGAYQFTTTLSRRASNNWDSPLILDQGDEF